MTSDGSPVAGGPFDGVTGILGISPLETARDPLVGCMIGDVEIVAVLAEGGMGRVYEGRQRTPARAVAVKVLRPGFITPEGVRRFAREAEVLGSLRHPNIAQVFWAGACDILGSNVPFIVMELVPGALPITEYALARGLDTPMRLDLFRKVAAAVAHGHAAGIVHRDLKPGNVLVDSFGEPKLIDFGIARLVEASGEVTALTECGRMVGTVQYMSPEQVAGDGAVDRRSDVYALGLLLHELVTGRRPYEIDPRRVFDAARAIRERKPVTLAVADGRRPEPGLEGVVERCLAIDPAARYADAAAVAVALDATVHQGQTVAWSSPGGWRWSVGAVAVIIGIVAVGLLLRRGTAQPDDRGAPSAVASATGVAEPQAAARTAPAPSPDSRPLSFADVNGAVPVDGILTFVNVADIPLEVAEALVNRGQRLRIYDLPMVGPELAAILGRNRRGVELLSVRTITPDIAASLAKTRGPLCLDRLEYLDVPTARALTTHRDWLNLCGMRAVPDDVVAELVRHGGHGMAIRMPGALDRDRAEIVARHRGELYLLGLDTIDLEAANILAGHRGAVHVDVAHVTPEVDRLLGEIQ